MKRTVGNIKSLKGKEKLSVITVYDYAMAKAVDDANPDMILVGDSLGNVILGFESTKEVTMEDMIRHTQAVAKGAKKTMVITDMPYKSDDTKQIAIKNAKLLLKAGADAVKVEGKPDIADALVKESISVMGHVGLLPQTAESMCMQGKDPESAKAIMDQALELEKCGCFAVVLECVDKMLAKKITQTLTIPTIGIGSGPFCDGQVLVSYDMLGLFEDTPNFVRRYADLKGTITKAVEKYNDEVRKGMFP